MDFLTRTTIEAPPSATKAEIDSRIAQEAVRAAELATSGILLRLWRPPAVEGEWANVGLWRAADEDALYSALASLPLREWMTIEVVPLSPHPNDPATTGDKALS